MEECKGLCFCFVFPLVGKSFLITPLHQSNSEENQHTKTMESNDNNNNSSSPRKLNLTSSIEKNEQQQQPQRPPPRPITHNTITQISPMTQLVLESKTLDVCFMDPVLINQFAFQCWLRGESIEETTHLYNKQQRIQQQQLLSNKHVTASSFSEKHNSPTQKLLQDLLSNEIITQYRLFDHIEPSLSQPHKLFQHNNNNSNTTNSTTNNNNIHNNNHNNNNHNSKNSTKQPQEDGSSGSEVQLAPSIRRQLIEQYFELNDRVVRELLGKKLTHKMRKDLDDVSERTGVKIVSCRRQFDNLRNVAQYLKCAQFHIHYNMNSGSGGGELSEKLSFDDVIRLLQQQFLLSEKLARKYAIVLFVGHHRFDCQKRKMKDFSFQHFEQFCTVIIYHWTNCRSSNTISQLQFQQLQQQSQQQLNASQQNMSQQQSQQWQQRVVAIPALNLLNLDFDFYVLRDIKQVVYGHKNRLSEYESGVIRELRQTHTFTVDQLARLEEKFSQLFKSLLVIGSGLVQTREIRDFFLDLYEKFVDVLVRQVGLSRNELLRFCDALITQLDSVKTSHHKTKFNKLWTAYVVTVRNISAEMYDAC